MFTNVGVLCICLTDDYAEATRWGVMFINVGVLCICLYLDFHARHAKEAPAMLARLKQAVIDNQNVFEVLMDAVRVCSLGQITNTLFEVGGQYRRNM